MTPLLVVLRWYEEATKLGICNALLTELSPFLRMMEWVAKAGKRTVGLNFSSILAMMCMVYLASSSMPQLDSFCSLSLH